MINKLFFLFIVCGISLQMLAQTPTNILKQSPLEVKPLKISLKFRVDKTSFLEKTEAKAATLISGFMFNGMVKHLESLTRDKQKCISFSRDTTLKNTDLTALVHFYRGETVEELTSMPYVKFSLIDNTNMDIIESIGFPVVQMLANKTRKDNAKMQGLDFNRIVKDLVYLADSVLNNYLAPCDGNLHYSQQKLHEKAIIFLAYPTTTPNKKDEKYLSLIDNVINNKFISTQIADENIIKDKHFIFYPYNKETKDIKPNVSIQLQLVQDKTDNYEIKATFVGKDIDLKNPTKAEMPTSVSIKLDKKRMDSGDYMELFYKLNYFIGGVYTYNILL